MLKLAKMPSSNNSKDVLTIIKGAKKRREMARCAVMAVNMNLGIKQEFVTVK